MSNGAVLYSSLSTLQFPLKLVSAFLSWTEIRHDGRVVHPEATIDPATTAPIGKNSEETVLVDSVLTFT